MLACHAITYILFEALHLLSKQLAESQYIKHISVLPLAPRVT